MDMAWLPAQVLVFERGWLSSNNVLLLGREDAVLVDTGYCTHAAQTLALVGHALEGRPLHRIVNTHLHSDHCGGNAALQQAHPGLRTSIPAGELAAVREWDDGALTYTSTGQQCPRFLATDGLRPGDTLTMGDLPWEVHGAPGHDPQELMLHQADHGILISADALWQNGYGVVFPELEGAPGFEDVGKTLDLIERLRPRVIIPGHGGVFTDVEQALARARRRLAHQRADPQAHARHALKVLLKFKLLEQGRMPSSSLLSWASAMPYATGLGSRYFEGEPVASLVERALDSLMKSGALRREGQDVIDC